MWAPPGHQHEVGPRGCHRHSKVGPSTPIPLACATRQRPWLSTLLLLNTVSQYQTGYMRERMETDSTSCIVECLFVCETCVCIVPCCTRCMSTSRCIFAAQHDSWATLAALGGSDCIAAERVFVLQTIYKLKALTPV